MMWAFAIGIVLLLGAIAVVAAGRGAPLEEVYADRPDARVPTGRRLVGEDLRTVRFSLAFRGYRMSEVDALLERLASELEDVRVEDRGDARPGTPDNARDDAPDRAGGHVAPEGRGDTRAE